MTTQNQTNAAANTTNTNQEGAQLVVSRTPVAQASTISVTVGVPGNLKKLVLEGDRQWTVADVLRQGEFNAGGYEIRMGGQQVQQNELVNDASTILLIKPVRGNVDEGARAMAAGGAPGVNLNKEGAQLVVSRTPVAQASTISVTVGVPGNLKKLVLEGDRQWTVADVLRQGEFNAGGYEIRMGGQQVQQNELVNDASTILLIKPVRGNVGEGAVAAAAGGAPGVNLNKEGAQLVVSRTPVAQASTISVTVGVPGNLKKLVLEGDRQWTVADVLRQGEFNAGGYEIRMGGQQVQQNELVNDASTILLIKPVRGNN